MRIKDQKIFSVLFYMTTLLCLLLIGSHVAYPIISRDSGYYLSIARDFYAGNIYFHEIGTNYNPLSIITFGIPYLFDENPDYIWHLSIHFLTLICSTIIFYKILARILSIKIYNLFFSSFFLLVNLNLDGGYILLEPLSVLFQLVSLNLYLSFLEKDNFRNIFLSGLFVSLAFLSKQYGLFIALPIGVDLLLRKRRAKNSMFIILGFLLPLFLFFNYLNTYGVGLVKFGKYILGMGFELDQGNGTALYSNVYSNMLSVAFVLLYDLYLLLIPFLILKYYSKLDDKKYLFVMLSLSSLLVLFFAFYLHYFQYIIPFWIILFVYLFQNDIGEKLKKVSVLLFIISIFFMGFYSIHSLNWKKESLATRKEELLIVKANIPLGSEAYLDGLSQSLYYTCGFKSINLKNISYSFPGYFYPITIVRNLKPGAYIIVSKDKFHLYEKIITNCTFNEISINSKDYVVIRKNIGK